MKIKHYLVITNYNIMEDTKIEKLYVSKLKDLLFINIKNKLASICKIYIKYLYRIYNF